MRYKLKNPTDFFDEILFNKGINLKKFSKIIAVNYSTIKKYRRGELTLPKEVFEKLVEYSSNKSFWLGQKIEFKNNWGALKGGFIAGTMSNKNKRAAYARKFRQIVNVKIRKNKEFCEFYGALLGDGCLVRFRDYKNTRRYVIQLTGNLKLDKDYWIYLTALLSNQYKLHSYYYERPKNNCCVLTIKNKGLFYELNKKFFVPIGLKYGKLKLPNNILNLPWKVKKFVLRGLFDTDGCIIANKRENYRYPWIVISSKSERFRNQLIKMLKEQNYPAYNTGSDVCVRGISNVKRWFDDIGSSNSRNLIKYEYFLKHRCLPARLL